MLSDPRRRHFCDSIADAAIPGDDNPVVPRSGAAPISATILHCAHLSPLWIKSDPSPLPIAITAQQRHSSAGGGYLPRGWW